MTDRKFTLFELHLHGGIDLAIGDSIGLPGEGTDASEIHGRTGGDPDGEEDPHAGCPGKKALSVLALVLAVVGVALAVRKVVGADLDAAEELDALGE